MLRNIPLDEVCIHHTHIHTYHTTILDITVEKSFLFYGGHYFSIVSISFFCLSFVVKCTACTWWLTNCVMTGTIHYYRPTRVKTIFVWNSASVLILLLNEKYGLRNWAQAASVIPYVFLNSSCLCIVYVVVGIRQQGLEPRKKMAFVSRVGRCYCCCGSWVRWRRGLPGYFFPPMLLL